jgi:hypothetical protein
MVTLLRSRNSGARSQRQRATAAYRIRSHIRAAQQLGCMGHMHPTFCCFSAALLIWYIGSRGTEPARRLWGTADPPLRQHTRGCTPCGSASPLPKGPASWHNNSTVTQTPSLLTWARCHHLTGVCLSLTHMLDHCPLTYCLPGLRLLPLSLQLPMPRTP